MPMERILDALEVLPEQEWLRVTISREPYPLYSLLRQMEFAWDTRRSGLDVIVRIWRARQLPPELPE